VEHTCTDVAITCFHFVCVITSTLLSGISTQLRIQFKWVHGCVFINRCTYGHV